MPVTTLSSREFNQDCSRAKRQATAEGRVYITDRGKPSHVLLSYEEYQRITGKKLSLADALYMPEAADIEIEFPRSQELIRPFDFD